MRRSLSGLIFRPCLAWRDTPDERTLLSFDFGTKSIGVAVGQRITGTARPLPAIKAQDGTPDWSLIERLLKEWQPDEIIVGLPLNMDGTEQPLTARAQIR